MRMSSIALLGISLIVGFSLLEAKDFGVRGHLFPIEEENMLHYLKMKMEHLGSEERAVMEEQVKTKVSQSVREPKAVSGIEEVQKYRSFLFDPSITVQTDIPEMDVLNDKGELVVARGSVAAKGTSVNPLHIQKLSEDLLFFDGDHPKQLSFARSQQKTCMWVLTKGKPLDLEEQEKRPVYFDQFGVLTKKFGIQAVPAKVTQEGDALRVEEIPVGEEQ